MNPIEYFRNKLPKCPHCDADFEVWDGDHPLSLDYTDGGFTPMECKSCLKIFTAVTHIDYKFSTAVSEDAALEDEWGPQAIEA